MNKTLQTEIRKFIGDDPVQAVEREYGLADYGSVLWDILTGGVYEMLALAATADAETRIAAMLWAAAWIVEVNENEET